MIEIFDLNLAFNDIFYHIFSFSEIFQSIIATCFDFRVRISFFDRFFGNTNLFYIRIVEFIEEFFYRSGMFDSFCHSGQKNSRLVKVPDTPHSQQDPNRPVEQPAQTTNTFNPAAAGVFPSGYDENVYALSGDSTVEIIDGVEYVDGVEVRSELVEEEVMTAEEIIDSSDVVQESDQNVESVVSVGTVEPVKEPIQEVKWYTKDGKPPVGAEEAFRSHNPKESKSTEVVPSSTRKYKDPRTRRLRRPITGDKTNIVSSSSTKVSSTTKKSRVSIDVTPREIKPIIVTSKNSKSPYLLYISGRGRGPSYVIPNNSVAAHRYQLESYARAKVNVKRNLYTHPVKNFRDFCVKYNEGYIRTVFPRYRKQEELLSQIKQFGFSEIGRKNQLGKVPEFIAFPHRTKPGCYIDISEKGETDVTGRIGEIITVSGKRINIYRRVHPYDVRTASENRLEYRTRMFKKFSKLNPNASCLENQFGPQYSLIHLGRKNANTYPEMGMWEAPKRHFGEKDTLKMRRAFHMVKDFNEFKDTFNAHYYFRRVSPIIHDRFRLSFIECKLDQLRRGAAWLQHEERLGRRVNPLYLNEIQHYNILYPSFGRGGSLGRGRAVMFGTVPKVRVGAVYRVCDGPDPHNPKKLLFHLEKRILVKPINKLTRKDWKWIQENHSKDFCDRIRLWLSGEEKLVSNDKSSLQDIKKIVAWSAFNSGFVFLAFMTFNEWFKAEAKYKAFLSPSVVSNNPLDTPPVLSIKEYLCQDEELKRRAQRVYFSQGYKLMRENPNMSPQDALRIVEANFLKEYSLSILETYKMYDPSNPDKPLYSISAADKEAIRSELVQEVAYQMLKNVGLDLYKSKPRISRYLIRAEYDIFKQRQLLKTMRHTRNFDFQEWITIEKEKYKELKLKTLGDSTLKYDREQKKELLLIRQGKRINFFGAEHGKSIYFIDRDADNHATYFYNKKKIGNLYRAIDYYEQNYIPRFLSAQGSKTLKGSSQGDNLVADVIPVAIKRRSVISFRKRYFPDQTFRHYLQEIDGSTEKPATSHVSTYDKYYGVTNKNDVPKEKNPYDSLMDENRPCRGIPYPWYKLIWYSIKRTYLDNRDTLYEGWKEFMDNIHQRFGGP